MTQFRGGVRLSVEALERRDVPSQLSIALDNIVSQQFAAAGTPAHGAFKYKYGPAYYETDTPQTPTYVTDTYFGAYACLALMQQKYVDPQGNTTQDADDRVRWWINWTLRTVAGDGTFFRRYYRADGREPVTTPVATATDAYDSDASLLLMVTNAYVQAGYDATFLTGETNRTLLRIVANKLLSLQQANGLTWAKDSFQVQYLMDNCESYAGFLAAAQLESAVWNNPTQAAVYSAAAARVKQGILTTLYDTTTGLFKPSDISQLDLQQLYPAYGITFPAMFGVLDLNLPVDLTIARRQVQTIDDYWNGTARTNWQTTLVTGAEQGLSPFAGDYFATPLLYSTLLVGDVAGTGPLTESENFTSTVYTAYYGTTGTTPQFTDLTVADNAWLALALGGNVGNPAITTLSVTGTAAADTFVFGRTPTRDPGFVTLSYNGGIPQAYAGISAVSVNGQNGNDLLTVYAANGTAVVTGAIAYNGGGGTNTLTVQADGQPVHATGSAVGIWEFFTTQFTNTQKVNVNAAFSVNSLAGPDTAARNALPTGQAASDRWVQRVYLDALGRPATASDRTFWLNQLAGGSSRATVAANISGSVEARTLSVRKWYSVYLGRGTNGGEENGWVNLLMIGQSEEHVIGHLLGSQEFYNRMQTLLPTGTGNERFVRGLYRFLLHRVPSAGEVTVWVNQLATSSRQAVANSFLTSVEYRNYQCSAVYAACLQRPADAVGVNTYLSSGTGIADLRWQVLASTEYYQL